VERITVFDTLRGYALNCAVATELRWQQDAKHKRWWSDTEGNSHCILFDDDKRASPNQFDPSHNVTDAWTLDWGNWHWSYYERYDQNSTINPTWLDMEVCAIGQDAEADVTLLFADFGSKAEAHSTARCIVWLKARWVQRQAIAKAVLAAIGEKVLSQGVNCSTLV